MSEKDRRDELEDLDEEVRFWRQFIRIKEAEGDHEMVRLGRKALVRAIRRFRRQEGEQADS